MVSVCACQGTGTNQNHGPMSLSILERNPMSKDAYTKGMGCLGSLLALAASIVFSFLNLRYGWGLEVKSWGAYIGFGIIGALVTFTLSHLFAKLAVD